ncbi:MAG: VCBS repeat-containing protein [Elusimicrobia bacterium]|nr:VCBS repeat-containing protein [Elusimicrobiota bacterium]
MSAVGFIEGDVTWGDYDNDGDLDVVGIGDTGGPKELYIYKNNGNATFNPTEVDVDPTDGGMRFGAVEWGDFDNDGDLDILATGEDNVTKRHRIYKNNGNGTLDASQIEVDGINGGVSGGGGAWGDFDNDGDLDILISGYPDILRVYKNNGNGSIDPAQIEVDVADGGLSGGLGWGDFDNDGDLDILMIGYYNSGATVQLRIYKNNGNGTINPSQIEVDGVNNGLNSSGVAWGDFDSDGDLDILAAGIKSSNRQLRVYQNNGNGTMDATQIEVDGLNGGLEGGEVAWGDYDNDGDLDILANGTNGNRQLRVYKNLNTTANTAPSAPSTLTSTWAYNASGTSTATFKWNPGADNGSPATPANVLTYQMEISTMSDFTGKSIVAGQWSTPGMGNYLKPPQIYDGNSNQGVGLRYLPHHEYNLLLPG